MNFFELINHRYSVRAYKSRRVSKKNLGIILNAARLAPTASNRQPFQVLVVHTKGRQEELRTIYPKEWFVQAPMILCVCGIQAKAWIRKDNTPYLLVDAAIVMDHMILAATELGLGTCWIAEFNANNARSVLALPEDVEPILFTPLGYPDCAPGKKKRKKLKDLVRYERW